MESSAADRVVAAVLGPAGRSARELRVLAFDRAGAIARGETVEQSSEPLHVLIDTVARNAYRVTGEQIVALVAAGHSEDELFDVIVAAAAGAGVTRRTRGLEAIASFAERGSSTA
jgi:hypothetical protein